MNRSRNICRAKLSRFPLLNLVGSLSLLLVATATLDSMIIIAQAKPVNTAAVSTSESPDPTINPRSARFWSNAETILDAQAEWLVQATAADLAADPSAKLTLSNQLREQLSAMDLFIQRYYRYPQQQCQTNRPTALLESVPELDLTQVETYCAIYQLSRDLNPLHQRLTQLPLPAEPTPTSLFRNPAKLAVQSAKRIEQFNSAEQTPPATSRPAFRYSQMVGLQPMKQLRAGDRPPVIPAMTPPPDLLKQLSQVETKLVAVQASLPRNRQLFAATSLPLSQPQKPTPPINQFAVPPAEKATYQAFLAQPQTGIDRVYPTTAFAPSRNRLRPNNLPLPFGLRMEAGQFLLGGGALNYGFMAEIGNVDLDDIQIDQGLPALFSSYTPPTTLAEIQHHQRRFLVGKDTPLGSEIPAKLNHTYVMRLLNYQLPELVTTGRPLQSGERGQLRTLLNYQSSDRLIAFRPVKQQDDGSYTILWKVLDTKAAPQISDLKNYVNVNLKTRSWR